MSGEPTEAQLKEQPGAPFRMDRTMIVMLVLAIMGAILFSFKEKEAFPEASLDLKLSKHEIIDQTLNWARKLNYRKDKLIVSTSFNNDNQAKNYLELEMGQKRASELMQSEIPEWYWTTRLCKEFDQEKFFTYISPTGKLISLWVTFQNDKALPSLTQDQARDLAKDFIEKDAGVSLADYTLITRSTSSLPHRKDHEFVWEDRKRTYKDANLRVSATVAGNQVSSYYYYLKVPEAWDRKFSTIRSYNELLGSGAFAIMGFLYLASSFVFVWAIATRNARWRMAAVFALIIFIGSILGFLNDWNALIDGYQTQSPFQSYIISALLKAIGICFALSLFAASFIISGEAIYRTFNPDRLALENYFEWRSLHTVELSKGLVVGICLFCVSIGWVVLYYLIGQHFGFWCPLDMSNYQVLSNGVPAYMAVCIGVEAAVNEEFLYRVICLSLARKLVRRFWLANLIQAVSWGFAHSTYPQEPPYARGLELTTSGLLFGWIMNRYGLIPCLIAHYLIDAFLTAQPLLGSGKPDLIISGLIPVVPMPLMAALAIARTRSAPQAEEPINNRRLIPLKEAAPVVEESPRRNFDYRPLTKRTRAILAMIMVVFATGGLAFNRLSIGKIVNHEEKLYISRDMAIRKGWEVLAAHGISVKPEGTPPKPWLVTASLDDDLDPEQMQYLFEKLGLDQTLLQARDAQNGFDWSVRFFKPMQAEEYQVHLDNRGRESNFVTILREDQPGAKLTEDQARKIAEKYIDQTYPQYKPYVFDSTTKSDKRERLDYTFTYTIPSQKVPDADAKISIRVVGDKVSNLSRFWELPDKWRWDRQKHTWRDDVFGLVRVFSVIIAVVAMLWWAIGLLRTGYVPFRAAIIFGGAMAVLFVPDALNNLAQIFASYSTTTPMTSFVVTRVVGILSTMASKFGQYGLVMLLALPCARIEAPDVNPLSLLSATLRPAKDERRTHRALWLDAVLVACFCIGLSWGMTSFFFWLRLLISPAVQISSLSTVENMANVYLPSLTVITDALSAGVSILLMVPIAVGLYAKYLRKFWVFLLFVVISACIMHSGERYWQDFVLDVTTVSLACCISWLLIAKLARNNMLAYVMLGMFSSVFGRLPAIFLHGVPLFSTEALTTCVLLALPIVYAVFINIKNKPDEPGDLTINADRIA